jgi:alpha-D-ribose 1-methylphosphonate 5-triphosphate synthase subunit PhnG
MHPDTRVELLAVADADELVALADRCLELIPDIVVTRHPEVGVVVLQVREPVEAIRVQLADVLVSRAEAALGEARGWAMRLGDCPTEALAAAICDAVGAAADRSAGAAATRAATDGSLVGPLAAEVEQLCTSTARRIDAARAAEWAELVPTIVRFEELDA